MVFHSFLFLVFLSLVYVVWRLLPFRQAKSFLCLASLFFYSYWFPPFVLLLLTTALLDFYVARRVAKNRHGKFPLVLSAIVFNLSLLGVFKYLNFFREASATLIAAFGWQYSPAAFDLLLPIGISFYTFESMSYLLDVYGEEVEPTKSLVDYLLYIGFFPHLVAGPIVRASDFLPQLADRAQISASDWHFGLYRILRGYFLKIVIADNVARVVDAVFSRPSSQLGGEVWLGALAFGIQIFCDFAGYSDIAIGIAKLFGFQINENFSNPYHARGIDDFWSRWHISLTSWFRDYVYYPLAMRSDSLASLYFYLFFVFLISGLWHGANWTFLLWGSLHGVALVLDRGLRRIRSVRRLLDRPFGIILSMTLTWLFLLFVWVPFRAPTIAYTLVCWRAMVGHLPNGLSISFGARDKIFLSLFCAFSGLQGLKSRFLWLKTTEAQSFESMVYLTLILLIPGPNVDFIYFQF